MKKGHLGSALPPADPILHGLGSLGTAQFQSPKAGLPSSAQLALPLFDHLLFSGLCSGFRVPHIAGKAEHRLPKGLRRTVLKHEEVQSLSKFSECVPRGCLRWAIHRQFDKQHEVLGLSFGQCRYSSFPRSLGGDLPVSYTAVHSGEDAWSIPLAQMKLGRRLDGWGWVPASHWLSCCQD